MRRRGRGCGNCRPSRSSLGGCRQPRWAVDRHGGQRRQRSVLGRRTGRAGLVLSSHGGGAFALAFDPEGRKIATLGWDGVVRLWDAVSGRAIGTPGRTVQYKSAVFGTALAFDATGTRLAATSDDGLVYVWDLRAQGPFGTPRPLQGGEQRGVRTRCRTDHNLV